MGRIFLSALSKEMLVLLLKERSSRSYFAAGSSLCMDYPHHDSLHPHRVYSLQAVGRPPQLPVTMMVNQVMMRVIHTAYVTLPLLEKQG